jgi:hypothetical protein
MAVTSNDIVPSMTPLSRVSTASNNAVLLKAGKLRLADIHATNSGEADAYLKVYDKASAPDPATDIPVLRRLIPAGRGFHWHAENGYRLTNGLAIVIVAGVDDTDETPVGAGEVIADFGVLA